MLVSNQVAGRLRCGRVVLAVACALALAFVLSACDGRATPISNQETEPAEMKSVDIPVEGMTCAACAARVRKGLTSMAGVSEAEVNLAERRARVRFDPSRLSPDELVAAIEALGYPAGAAADARP